MYVPRFFTYEIRVKSHLICYSEYEQRLIEVTHLSAKLDKAVSNSLSKWKPKYTHWFHLDW